MRKKVMIIVLIVILVIVAAVAGVFIFGRVTRVEIDPSDVEIVDLGENSQGIVSLIAEAQTEEEAEKIAELYGITLVKYDGTFALYETEQDAEELIEMGKEKGYPLLEVNCTVTID